MPPDALRPVDTAAALLDGAPALAAIPAGQIWLKGEGSRQRWSVELPPFLIGRFAATRGQYRRVLAPDSVGTEDADLPVVDVSWHDAIAFCNVLSRREGLRVAYTTGAAGDVAYDTTADGYRLPTEAEWEHACRAGSTDARYGDLDDIAWHAGNAGGYAHAVGAKQPNAWGLYDAIGNVWEWCWDLFDPAVYGEYRVFRGGGWSDAERGCRASCRRKSHPTFRIDDLGFRVARSPGAAPHVRHALPTQNAAS